MKINGKTLAFVAGLHTKKSAMPMLEHVRVHGDTNGVALQLTDLYYYLEYRVHGAVDPIDVVLPGEWLSSRAKVGAKHGDVELLVEGFTAKMIVGANHTNVRTYKSRLDFVDDKFPAMPAEDGSRCELHPADWSKGGAVAKVAPYASTDECRSNVHAVHLGALVSATDGKRMSRQKPLADMAGLNALVPLPEIKRLLKLVQETAPKHLSCSHEPPMRDKAGGIWFYGTDTEHGDSWTFWAKLPDAEAPPYASAAVDMGGGAAFSVDVEDLRSLAKVYARDGQVAFYANGLLAWDKSEFGIGTTLTEVPTTPPLAVAFFSVLKPLVERLPKHGTVELQAKLLLPDEGEKATKAPGWVLSFAGEIVMGVRSDVQLPLLELHYSLEECPHVPVVTTPVVELPKVVQAANDTTPVVRRSVVSTCGVNLTACSAV